MALGVIQKAFERLSIAVFIQQGGKGFIQFMEGLQAGEYALPGTDGNAPML